MNPTGMEQEMLEMINRMRMTPQEELDRIFLSTNPGDPNYFRTGDPDVDGALSYFGVDAATLFSQWASLTPTAPLAWNESLIDAARNHSNRMMLQDLQSHQLPADSSLGLPAEPSLLNRAVNAGYNWSGSVSVGENVFAYAESMFHSHVAFAIDWGNTATGIQSPPGHRENIMDPRIAKSGLVSSTTPTPARRSVLFSSRRTLEREATMAIRGCWASSSTTRMPMDSMTPGRAWAASRSPFRMAVRPRFKPRP